MCYHDLYLFLACGHAISGTAPIANAPPCPAVSCELFRRPSLASPISPTSASASDPWSAAAAEKGKRVRNHTRSASRVALGLCHEKLAHPLHTFRLQGLCARCASQRERRLARFEVGSIKASVERDFARRRQEEHARMKTSLKMMRDAKTAASREEAKAMEAAKKGSAITTADEGYMESIGRVMEGVRERILAWGDQDLGPADHGGKRASWVGVDNLSGRH